MDRAQWERQAASTAQPGLGWLGVFPDETDDSGWVSIPTRPQRSDAVARAGWLSQLSD